METALFFLLYLKGKMRKTNNLDYSRVEIAVAARPQPMKL
jgi:hypothetical protein